MKNSEIASEQLHFENTRGPDKEGRYLFDLNTPQYMLDRFMLEFEELRQSMAEGQDVNEQLREVADCLIILGSVAAHMCLENGLPLSAIDKAVKEKLERNYQKYRPEPIHTRTVGEGMLYDKSAWSEKP